jgi:hypothetical protein
MKDAAPQRHAGIHGAWPGQGVFGMKIWDKISSLIADEKKGTGEQTPQAAAAQPQPVQPAASVHAVAPEPASDQPGMAGPPLSQADANTVLSMLPKGQGLDQFSAGQIQLLNIESVRADLGDRWAKFEHQVHMLVEATLRRMLSESDIFTQISDNEYLVIFPNLTEQKASALMYVAAAQIRQKLFGQDSAFAAIRLNATVTRVGRDVMDKPPDAVTSIHEATLLGPPAQPATDKPQQQPLTSPIAPWTDKYKIVPIEGGNMTQSRLVADAMRAGNPGLDFSGVAGIAQAGAAASAQSPDGAAPNADQAPPAPGYPVVSLASSGRSERRMVTDAPRPQTRLPDFSSVHATRHARPGMPGTSTQAPASADAGTPLEVGGYPVTPITGSGTKDSFLVQGTPRAAGRVPDFSTANTAAPAAPHATGAMPGGVIVPVLADRLNSLANKSAPLKAVLITRPSDAPAGSAVSAGSAHEQAAQIAPVEIEELQLLYEPIWEVKLQAVTAQRMNITLKVEGALLGLNEFLVTYDDPKLRVALNSVILRKLVSQFQLMRGEKKKAIIVVPIGRRSIEDESGLRFVLDQLSLLTEQERQLVVLEISNAYFGSWPTLTPRIAMLHRVCRNVAIRLSLDHKDFQQVAATGANTVTGDLSDHDWPERQTMAALNAFAAGATKASLRSSVSGLATSSTVIAAVCAGLSHLSGKAVGEGTPVSLGVYPLSTEGFYLQRQAQRLQQEQSK